jgi:hypothetical protein
MDSGKIIYWEIFDNDMLIPPKISAKDIVILIGNAPIWRYIQAYSKVQSANIVAVGGHSSENEEYAIIMGGAGNIVIGEILVIKNEQKMFAQIWHSYKKNNIIMFPH